jgi:hypothetical protein
MLGRLIRFWNKIWFEPLPAHPLALFRIAFGLYLLVYFLRYLSIVELSFSNQGVYSPFWIPDIAPPPAWAWVIYLATLLCIACFTLGLFTRIMTVLVFGLFEYHFFLNFAVHNCTYDRINNLVLFVLCFSDSGAVWSLDARRSGQQRFVPAWQIRLLKFQLAAVYFGSGLWKLCSSPWHTGEMVEFTLASPWASPVAFEILRYKWPGWVFACLTWSVVIFELAAGFTLYFRRTRVPTMIVGTLFHLSNTFVLLVPGF